MQLHDLGAMHQALTAVGHEVRLRRTPVAERRRPLLRPAQIEDLPADLDHAAVDHPRQDWRHLTVRDRDHGLVEQRQALDGLSHPDQHPALAMPTEDHQIAVTEADTDLGGLVEGCVRGREVALGAGPQPDGHQEISLFRAVELSFVDQSLRPRQPATRPGHLPPVQQFDRQPERAPSRSRRIPQAQALLMRTLPRRDALGVPTDQISGRCDPLKILRPKRRLVIRGRQAFICVRPGMPAEGSPPTIACVGRRHTRSLSSAQAVSRNHTCTSPARHTQPTAASTERPHNGQPMSGRVSPKEQTGSVSQHGRFVVA
jgi:hypothetical protein